MSKEDRFNELAVDLQMQHRKDIPEYFPKKHESVKDWMTRVNPDEYQLDYIPLNATFNDIIKYNNKEVKLPFMKNLDTSPRIDIEWGGMMYEYVILKEELGK